jgi:hypothetical protein
MKAISIILKCYGKRLVLLNIEPQVNGLQQYIDSVKKSIFEPEFMPHPFILIVVDWAGFEPATFRLRIERSYHTELPAHFFL